MAWHEPERETANSSALRRAPSSLIVDEDHKAFRLKLGAIAIGLVLINLAVGLFAREQQRAIIDYAVNIYDTAFTSTNYIHHAQISFQHFSDDRVRAVGPAEISLANESLTKAIDQLDVAIERSNSPRARTEAVAVKEKLLSLAKVEMEAPELLARQLQTIEEELERLGQRSANMVLRARDDVEEFASKTDLLSLVSTFTSIMLAGLALIGLHRMVNSANRSRAQFAETLQANARERRRLEAQEKEAAARERKAELKKLADDFQAAVGHVVDSVMSTASGLEGAATTLTQTAETTEQLSSTVAQASERASTNVHSVAASTEEIALSFGEIGRRVQESHKIASEAVRQAQQTDARIHELSTAASRIGNVVKLITSVAEQTNLLALNATIEAARAGEAGRGFAVVAQEVKALASQTTKAIDEIHAQITGIQSATEDTVTSIRVIGATIGQMSEISMIVATAMVEQDATTKVISHNVSEAAKDTAQVAINITNVNRGANETRFASAQLLSSAQLLTNESNRLKAEVAKFLDTVRAA